MSLATRCTACGTVFRVVQDQLKVSEGWVRCGRCQEVFNALEGLFDLDRDAAPAQSPQPEPPPSPAVPAQPASASTSGRVPLDPAVGSGPVGGVEPFTPLREQEPAPADTVIESRMSSQFDGDSTYAVASGPAVSSGVDADDLDDDFADARFNTSLLAADAAADDEAALQQAEADDAETADEAPAAAPSPSFLTDAERAERWRRPGVRMALLLGSSALLAALMLQVSLQFHDSLAARWPSLRGPLAALCEAANCSLEPPRQLDAVSVDSSGLTRASDNSDAYRLSLVLRNRAEFPVAPPSVELSLTDANGQLVSRRVFAPSEFNAAPASLAPLAETPMNLMLATGERISGYTIEIFYP